MSRKLHEIAHCRAGDKGDTLILSLIAYREEDWPILRDQVSADRLRAHLEGIVAGKIVRYELPKLWALQFVCQQALCGGVNTSLAMDTHGKSLSYAVLAMIV